MAAAHVTHLGGPMPAVERDPMLEGLMQKIGKGLVTLLFSVLLLSFAFWGIPQFNRDAGRAAPVAQVGEAQISSEQYLAALSERRLAMGRQFKTNITPEQARAFGLDQQVLSEMVSGAAVTEHARLMGLRISDTFLADQIRTNPLFQGADKKFSKQVFESQLAQFGLTTDRYFVDARTTTLREQVTSGLAAGLTPSPVLIDIAHRFRDETRTVAYITLDPSKIAKPAAPDEAKLKEQYERVKMQFKTLEVRAVSILMLTRDDVKARFKIEDAEVRAYWEKASASWDVPERRKYQMVTFPDRAAAATAAKDIAAGKSLFMIALDQPGITPRIDNGPSTRREIPETRIAAEVFRLAANQLSEPIEIRAGGRSAFVILRVIEIEAGRKRPFEEVAKDVRAAMEQARVNELEKQLHEQVEDRRGARRPLTTIAEELKLKIITIPSVDRNGMAPGNKPALAHPDARRLLTAAFEGDKAAVREVIALSGGGEAWVEVTEVKTEAQKPLEDVRADVLAIWTDIEHQKAIGQVADTLVERLKKGETLEAIAKPLGLKVETTPPFKRTQPPAALPPSGARQAFALPKGAASAVEKEDDKKFKTRVVFVVTDIKPAAAPTKEEAERLTTALREQIQNDALATYVTALRDRLGFQVFQANYERAVGIERQAK